MKEPSAERPATVLVATEGEWAGRALESVLSVQGYTVRRTENGREALRLARRIKPDALILDQNTAELSGTEITQQLRDDPTFDPATPIMLIAGSPLSRVEREAAYDAGVWSYSPHPVDTEILLRELSTFVRARQAVVESRDESQFDPATGVLSASALERWAEKLAAVAERKHEPLACVVLMAVTEPNNVDSVELNEIAATFIELSRAHMRQSDVVGRTTDGRLALLAPDTDGAGALGFVQRLRSAIELASSKAKPRKGKATPDFRAGYYAIDDFGAASVEPSELIRRATRAVEHAHRSTGELTFNFNHLPLN